VTRLASCSCGQLAAAVEGEPVRVSVCHCLACQRRSGSVFATQARFPRTAVRVDGSATSFVRIGGSGACATFYFCPRCGTTVWYEAEGLEDFITIPVGTFADPAFPAPTVSVYEERKHAWVSLPSRIEHHF
jgi:hypothetical protein